MTDVRELVANSFHLDITMAVIRSNIIRDLNAGKYTPGLAREYMARRKKWKAGRSDREAKE